MRPAVCDGVVFIGRWLYVCMRICVYVCMRWQMDGYMCVPVCEETCTCTCTCMCMCGQVYGCICVCVHVCVCMYLYAWAGR